MKVIFTNFEHNRSSPTKKKEIPYVRIPLAIFGTNESHNLMTGQADGTEANHPTSKTKKGYNPRCEIACLFL